MSDSRSVVFKPNSRFKLTNFTSFWKIPCNERCLIYSRCFSTLIGKGSLTCLNLQTGCFSFAVIISNKVPQIKNNTWRNIPRESVSKGTRCRVLLCFVVALVCNKRLIKINGVVYNCVKRTCGSLRGVSRSFSNGYRTIGVKGKVFHHKNNIMPSAQKNPANN